MCYMPAEILNLAYERNVCYVGFFLADRENSHVSYPFCKPGRVYISKFQHFNSKGHYTIVKYQENFFYDFFPLLKPFYNYFNECSTWPK